MSKLVLADVIIPHLFAPYFLERTPVLSALIAAGIAQKSPEFDAIATAGGVTASMPFWKEFTGSSEVLSDSGDLTPNKITSAKDICSIHNRGKAWSVNDLAKWSSGDDPAKVIGDGLADWAARDRQEMVLACLKGLFNSTNGVLSGTHLLNIYSDVAAGAITDAMRLTGSTFIDGLQKLGDAKKKLTAVVMHSDTEAFLLQRDLIDYIPDSEGKDMLATFQGKRVIVDDNCPKTAGANSYNYYTYLFGEGAFAWGDGTLDPNEAIEHDRVILASDSVLVSRSRFIIHPRGVAFTGTPAGASPTNAELETGTNWTKKYENKNIRMVAIKHNLNA